MPSSWLFQNSLRNGGSVAAFWVTSNCRGVSSAIASGSLRYWVSVMEVVLLCEPLAAASPNRTVACTGKFPPHSTSLSTRNVSSRVALVTQHSRLHERHETMTTTPLTSGPNKLLIALIAVGGVLLLTITAVVFLLVGQNSAGGSGHQRGRPGTSSRHQPDRATPTAEPADEGSGAVADGQSGNSGGGQNSRRVRRGSGSRRQLAPLHELQLQRSGRLRPDRQRREAQPLDLVVERQRGPRLLVAQRRRGDRRGLRGRRQRQPGRHVVLEGRGRALRVPLQPPPVLSTPPSPSWARTARP